MSKILKNNTGSAQPIADTGEEVPASGELTIDPASYNLYSASANTMALITDLTLTINNGSKDLEVAEGINYLIGGMSDVCVANHPTFADKTTADGNKMYRRKHGGTKTTIANGASEEIDFVVPYDTAKINEIEIIGCDIHDTVNLKVYDTPTGTISTIPNYMLNQFGFSVNLPADFYKDKSNYDADVIKDMKIELSITNNSGAKETTARILFTINSFEVFMAKNFVEIKIGFSRPRGKFFPIFSWLIRLIELTSFSHTYARYVHPWTRVESCFHAAGNMIHFLGPEAFDEQITVIEEYTYLLPKTEFKHFHAFTHSLAGKKYSFRLIIGILWHKMLSQWFGSYGWNPFLKKNEELWVCSRLMRALFRDIFNLRIGTLRPVAGPSAIRKFCINHPDKFRRTR